jgi:hypothetical protein
MASLPDFGLPSEPTATADALREAWARAVETPWQRRFVLRFR